MNRRAPAAAFGCVLLAAVQAALADVTIEERISLQGAGALAMANMSGTSKTMIAGDRARMESDMQMQSRLVRMFARGAAGPTAEIVRLDQDKVYQLDVQRKQYTETSLAELRAQTRAAMEQMSGAGQPAGQAGPQQPAPMPVDESQCEWSEPKAEVTKTGERGTFAGFDAERVRITASQACKDKSTGQVCEFALSLDQWLAPEVAGGDDVLAFQRAYAAKMGLDAAGSKNLAERAQSLFGRYEGIWSQVARQMGEVQGYPVKSSFALEIGGPQCQSATDAGAGQPAADGAGADGALATAAGEAAGQVAAEEAGQSALGGIAGQIGGRIAGSLFGRRKQQEQAEEAPAAATGRLTLMTITSELVAVSRAPVAAASFEVPGDFRKVSAGE